MATTPLNSLIVNKRFSIELRLGDRVPRVLENYFLIVKYILFFLFVRCVLVLLTC